MKHLLLIGMLAALLTACGGGTSEPPPPSVGSATIDAAGGTVDGPDGVALVVPAGAVTTATTFRIARDGSGAPEAGGVRLITPVYAITPHGTEFAESARIRIPYDPAAVAPGTQPVVLKAQPGGGWTVLAGETAAGTVTAADTPSLSYYAVGSCYTSRDVTIGGPDPLLYCPSAHQLTLTLQDGSGVALPVQRNSGGTALPALTIAQPTTLNYTVYWNRPAGTARSDLLDVIVSGANLLPAQQPLRNFAVSSNNFALPLQTPIDPATVPGAGAAGGVVVRIRATASYTVDAFYPGCVCFRPATWTFEAEVPVRVIYRGVQPTITRQPANRAVSEGQTATFDVAATGQSLSFQWFRDGSTTPLSGATGASFTTPATRLADNGALFNAKVCSTLANPVETVCVNSNAALLSVSAVTVAPTFTTSPQSITVTEGETVNFTAVASGQPAPLVGWSRLRPSGPFIVYEDVCTSTTGSGGVTSATCHLGAMTLADNGAQFIAGASNSAGSVNSAVATVTVVARPVAPTITSAGELRDQTVSAGGSVSWTVAATGSAPISYAWSSLNGSGAPQAGIFCPDGSTPTRTVNGGTLTLTNVPAGCNGLRLQVVVSNGAGAANPAARVATLTVNAPPAAPQIAMPLADRAVLDGTQVTFSVLATGTPANFSYAWTFDGGAVPNVVSGCGTTSASCTFTAMLEHSGKLVAVSVANGVAPNARSSATLTVTTNDVPASIATQPSSQSVVAGATASFTVGVAGTPTPTVQWQTSPDGSTWTNTVTGSSFVIAGTTLAQDGLRVRAVASNATRIPGGTQPHAATSVVVTLSVVANVPADALTAVQVITVAGRTLALRPDGSVVAWGRYVDPVHGGYTAGGTNAARPTRVLGLQAIRQVAIGSHYASWALGQDGSVWGWGFLNSYEAFAQGPGNTSLEFFQPVRLLVAANTPIDRVCQIEGTLYGVVMVRSEVAGGTCAANEPRSVWYTANISGNEATAQRYAQRFTPLDSGGALLPAGRWVHEIVSSRDHGANLNSVFARANDGSVYAWGNLNGQGQLGLGHTNPAATPQLASGWQGAVRIAAAGEATLALMADGSVKGAGSNAGASLGLGPVSTTAVSTPTTLPGLAGAGDVATTSNLPASMALIGGELRYWGSNTRFASGTQTSPVAIAAPATPLSQISVGGEVAVAIGPGSVVYAWGAAELRGCALNATDCNANTTVPTLVTMPPAPAPMRLFAGDFSAGGGGGSGDGTGTAARFDFPEALTADAAGNLYVPNSNGGRVMKVTSGAVASTIALHAGTTQLALTPDGGLYSAAVSYCGLVRIAPPLQSNATTESITLTGCPGTETRGAAVDASGTLVLVLRDANSVMRISTPVNGQATATLVAGAASTFAPGGSADGAGVNARFNAPRGIAVGPDGALYVADSGNHTIRRIGTDAAHTVTTFAGTAGAAGTVDGSSAAARFHNPTDLAFDAAGNLIVLQRGPDASPQAWVRKITPAGVVSTLFDATSESVALAGPGQVPFAQAIRGMAVLNGRIALSAGNAILMRSLP